MKDLKIRPSGMVFFFFNLLVPIQRTEYGVFVYAKSPQSILISYY